MEKNTEKDWFKLDGIGGIPKPIRWQGWTCYGIFLLSLFLLVLLMIVYDVNSWIINYFYNSYSPIFDRCYVKK